MMPSPREKVLEAFELRQDNSTISYCAMAKVVKVHRDTVKRWFTDEKLNPYLDDVAITRAVGGDVKVYDALTYFELEVVLAKLQAWLDSFKSDRFAIKGMDEGLVIRSLRERFGARDCYRIYKALDRYRDRVATQARRAA